MKLNGSRGYGFHMGELDQSQSHNTVLALDWRIKFPGLCDCHPPQVEEAYLGICASPNLQDATWRDSQTL